MATMPKLISASTISAHSSGPGAGVAGRVPFISHSAKVCSAK
jgi:hypothetical protein